MKNIFLIIVFIFGISFSSCSQNKFKSKPLSGYKISGDIKGLQDTSVILAYYFGGKQFAADTAKVVDGRFTFEGKKELSGGMYLVVLSNQRYFDIIISEQHFSFSTDVNNLVESMEFKNSKENPPFYQYLSFIGKMNSQVTPIRQKMETVNKNEKITLQKQIDDINNQVIKYRDNFIKKNSNIFFTNIVKATIETEIPESPMDSTGKPDQTFPYRYYKKHFWDNINFSDARMLRTPIFFNKMEQFLDKLTAKHPDSIIVSADKLVELSRANDEIFQYVVSHITSTYERSKIMGMDAVFVHMVETYYVTNQCNWVDSTQLAKISDRAQKIAPNLLGRKASEFLDFYGRPFMKDTLGKLHTIQEINAEYTVLIFYGPTCGHCKKEVPKVKNVLDSLINLGSSIKTLAVATEFDKKEWKKFIRNQKTGDWINVADINHDDEGNPVASSDWRDKYDIYSTPVIYLLDKDKKIIAKRITHNQIADIIDRRKL
ncbi:MAG: hypothetical protein CMD05_03305 [Flavobacteriales bacterium]|nr:hypothetical protein [Flavobacteriales bacterium]